jgi:hypothetical protein
MRVDTPFAGRCTHTETATRSVGWCRRVASIATCVISGREKSRPRAGEQVAGIECRIGLVDVRKRPPPLQTAGRHGEKRRFGGFVRRREGVMRIECVRTVLGADSTNSANNVNLKSCN